MRSIDECACQIGPSMAVSFWNKNRAQSAVYLLHITADCARRKNNKKKFFIFFFQNSSQFAPYFWKKTISRRNNIPRASLAILKIIHFLNFYFTMRSQQFDRGGNICIFCYAQYARQLVFGIVDIDTDYRLFSII